MGSLALMSTGAARWFRRVQRRVYYVVSSLGQRNPTRTWRPGLRAVALKILSIAGQNFSRSQDAKVVCSEGVNSGAVVRGAA
jgi:hypothetical protein